MSALAVLALAVAATALAQNEAGLRAADAAQHEAARANDGGALAAMTHPNFRLFAPEGYIGDRQRLIDRFNSAETGYVRFERLAESVALSGDVGIVMGRETVARKDRKPIARRFTNVWLWSEGRWQWLARHANEVTEQGSQ